MTTQDKNVEITKMLGFKFYSKYMELGRSEGSPSVELPNFIDIYGETLQAPNLKFHSDANWQFEALDWIEKLDNPDWFYQFMMIESNNISISARSKKDGSNDFEWYSVFQKGYHNWTRKEAIFEALFQFSQYLKEKDGTK